GLGGGAVGTYLPLFAQESLGYHVTTAGFAVAVAGFTAIVFRVAWGHFTEKSGRFASVLCTMALLAAAAMVVLWISGAGVRWLLWPAALLLGTSNGSWNAAAMLAVISLTAGRDPGRASGMVMLGFGTGLALGPPIFGFTVDTSGGYRIGLTIVLIWFTVAVLITRLWAHAEHRR
ncbi:MAG: MFS transporter, partial [Acidimicrobiia bacterium]